jgi:type I restriction enzyme, S subunit
MDTKALRQKILDLAIHGHLLPQDPNDEPAIELLKRINPKAEISYDEKLPKGWVTCQLENIVSYEQPTSYIVKSTAYDNSYTTPVLTAGKSFIIGYTNETDNIYSKLPCIIFDDFTTDSKFVDFPFKVKSSAMKILQVSKDIEIKYVAIFMSITQIIKDTHKRYWISEYSKLKIPLPPKQEQERIVKEIERWFDLIDIIEKNKTNLKQTIKQTKNKILDLAIHGHLLPQDPNDEPAIELLKRIRKEKEHLIKEGTIKKTKQSPTSDTPQYPYTLPKGWEWTTIGEIFNITSAKRVLKSDWQSEGIPFYRAREIVQLDKEGIADKDLFITPKLYNELKVKYGIPKAGDIMLSAVGSIGNSYIVKENDIFYYKDASVLCLQNVHNLHSKFFKIWLSTPFIHRQMKANSKGTTVDTITLEKLGNYIFPLPPLAEQERIVEKIEKIFAVLDRIEREV